MGERSKVGQPLVQASLVGEAIDHGPVAVFVADEDMRYVAVNAYACELLGYERDELLSLSVAEVAVARDTPKVYEEFLAAGEGSGRIPLRRKDGETVQFEYRAAATTVAGLALYVSVGWPVSEPPPPQRRSARARG